MRSSLSVEVVCSMSFPPRIVARFVLALALLCGGLAGPGRGQSPQSGAAGSEPADRFTRHIDIAYVERPEYTLRCDIFVPPGDGPFPAVLALHGGAWRFGSKWQLARQVRQLTQAGFVVVAANYRLAPEWKFPAQVQDGFAALAWMQNNAEAYRIDPAQIFGYGYSAGGHLIALMAVSRAADWDPAEPQLATAVARPPQDAQAFSGEAATFRAVAVGGAPCDFQWLADDDATLEYWLGGSRQQSPQIYAAVTPLDKVSRECPPFFLFHAADDPLVPLACARRMQAALAAHDVPCQLLVIGDSSHLVAFNDPQALQQTIDFFRTYLKPR